MTTLFTVFKEHHQSIWLDYLSRDFVQSGGLSSYVRNGVRGITTNPTILYQALLMSDAYDSDIHTLALQGLSNEAIYTALVYADIKAAASVLEPVYLESGGQDGYVSIEVSPMIAYDTEKTIVQARSIWQDLQLQNVMIKIPATEQGLLALKTLLQENININVTLLFDIEIYKRVVAIHKEAHALLSGNTSRSVASFFVSRIDSSVDQALQALGTEEALALQGKAAIAQALIAYEYFIEAYKKEIVSDDHGPDVQRLLWASTSTKNPLYDDLLYVRSLLAQFTVNTVPIETLQKIEDHFPVDTPAVSMHAVEMAKITMQSLQGVGVSMNTIASTLLQEGVRKFQESYQSLLAVIDAKRPK